MDSEPRKKRNCNASGYQPMDGCRHEARLEDYISLSKRLAVLAMAGKTESYAFLERFREARNCHRVYERQGDY
jgi:hypothetical protein